MSAANQDVLGLAVQYCSGCGMPPEYCEWAPPKLQARCVAYHKRYLPNSPFLAARGAGDSAAAAPTEASAENNEDENDSASESEEEDEKQAEEEQPQPKPAPQQQRQYINMYCQRRKGKKKVTIVRGVIELGMKPKKIQTEFRRKFAASCSVVKAADGASEVVVQGDHRLEVATHFHEQYRVPPLMLMYGKPSKKSKGVPAYQRFGAVWVAQPPPEDD
ncbi:MAG: hypothetical protein MHM6MM_005507 [Cercozoa sp. M6MM]